MLVAFCVMLSFSLNVTSERLLAVDFTLEDIEGGTFTLSDHTGKVVLIDFTATTCVHCVSIQAELKVLRENFGEEELVMTTIGVSEADTVEDIRNFKLQHGGDWTYAKDTQDLGTIYDIRYTPIEYIIDVNGYIYSVRIGNRSWEELAADIEAAKIGYDPPVDPPPANGELAPDFSLTDIDSVNFALSDQRGKVVLIDLFASDAYYSGKMQEEFRLIRENFTEEELVIISIAVGDHTIEEIRDFKSTHGGDWIYAEDTQDVWISYGVISVPTGYVVDVDGYVHSHKVNYEEWDDLADDIETAKAGTEPPVIPDSPTLPLVPILIGISVAVAVAISLLLVLIRRRKGR